MLLNEEYYLSNSEANAWEEMCPLMWKARFIDGIIQEEESADITVMDWGVLFETLAIGSGVMGKTIPDAKLAKMQKSEYYKRVSQQAAECRTYFKALGGKIVSRQDYIFGSIQTDEGQEIKICGGLDLLYEFPDGERLIIDLKLTGDTDNDFGKYQFGNVNKINPQQGIHYRLLHRAKYGFDAAFQYWVFDKSHSMKQTRIGVNVSEIAELMHIAKFAQIYNDISFAIGMDDWGYKNTFNNCRSCPIKCQHQRILPDLQELSI